jgi:hypothetical protein
METTTPHKLFTYNELKDHQQAGTWPLADSTLLSTKYADRWEMAKKLHDTVDVDFWKKNNTDPQVGQWANEDIPNKLYSDLYSGDVFSLDKDYCAGPNAWLLPEDGIRQDETVNRTKIYIMQYTDSNYQEGNFEQIPEELEYFIEMHKDFQPVMEHYLYENYSDQMHLWQDWQGKFDLGIIYKLMVIKYSTPCATPEQVTEHRKHCSLRYGRRHCDETLGGLHLGENYSEFWAENTKTKEQNMITELADDKMLWMHGEDSEQSGWIPTYHGVVHNPQNDLGDRYSIIIDLQARYK